MTTKEPKQPRRMPGWTVAVLIAGLLTFTATAIGGFAAGVEETTLLGVLAVEFSAFTAVVAFMKGWGQASVIVLAFVLASSTMACGSSAALATPIQTIPQHVSLTLDASDGGVITIGGSCGPEAEEGSEEREAVAVAGDCGGGSVWLDARGGGATADTEQVGTVIRTAIDAALSAQVPITTGTGAASTGAMDSSTPTSGPTRRASTTEPSSGAGGARPVVPAGPGR